LNSLDFKNSNGANQISNDARSLEDENLESRKAYGSTVADQKRRNSNRVSQADRVGASADSGQPEDLDQIPAEAREIKSRPVKSSQ